MLAPRQWQSLAEVVLCSGFPTQLGLTAVAALVGMPVTTATGGLSLGFVTFVSAADTILLLLLIAWFLRLRGETPRDVFLGSRPIGAETAVGLLLAPAIVVFMGVAMWGVRRLLPGLPTVPENPFGLLAQSPAGAITVLLVALVAGGLREEVQRGFLLHRFRDLGGPANGLLITSIVFGLGHVVQGWDAVLVTGSLGAFWGALYLFRGSVVAPVISHALANGTQVLIAFMQGQAGVGS
jgi:membrane protease YdiL (CAAX protease family)